MSNSTLFFILLLSVHVAAPLSLTHYCALHFSVVIVTETSSSCSTHCCKQRFVEGPSVPSPIMHFCFLHSCLSGAWPAGDLPARRPPHHPHDHLPRVPRRAACQTEAACEQTSEHIGECATRHIRPHPDRNKRNDDRQDRRHGQRWDQHRRV